LLAASEPVAYRLVIIVVNKTYYSGMIVCGLIDDTAIKIYLKIHAIYADYDETTCRSTSSVLIVQLLNHGNMAICAFSRSL